MEARIALCGGGRSQDCPGPCARQPSPLPTLHSSPPHPLLQSFQWVPLQWVPPSQVLLFLLLQMEQLCLEETEDMSRVSLTRSEPFCLDPRMTSVAMPPCLVLTSPQLLIFSNQLKTQSSLTDRKVSVSPCGASHPWFKVWRFAFLDLAEFFLRVTLSLDIGTHWLPW